MKMNKEYVLPSIELINDSDFRNFIERIKKNGDVIIPIGKESNSFYYESLKSMPNLLVGGTVASGKSSFIHMIISTILLTKKPSETKLVILDSKKIEYKQYDGIAHLLLPIISDEKKGAIALQKICYEIEKRMEEIDKKNCKSIKQYNDSLLYDEVHCPDIVIVIDDFDSFSINESINKSIEFISKYGWNVNVYLIITSNHPSSKVISSISKANFPSRMCFSVPSKKDSMVVLDEPEAFNLREKGTALYKSMNTNYLKKVKTLYITEEEIRLIINHIINEQKRLFESNVKSNEKVIKSESTYDMEKYNYSEEYNDPLYDEIVEYVIISGKASASLLQRRFKLGYNRAARIVDLMEERGVIGPQNGSKPREVLAKLELPVNYDEFEIDKVEESKNEVIEQDSDINMNYIHNIRKNSFKGNKLTNNQRLLLSLILIIFILLLVFIYMQ